MKFGENLYLRSIPQWSYYNVDYNGLKDLIKQRTSNPPTEPVFIPGQGPPSDRWHSLEDELFPILREQHSKPGAFIRSKYGEIERRLTHLARRVETLQRSLEVGPGRQRVQQSRRYQKLVQDADGLSEDIQALARFANTQRQAFRKILKKYEKWTKSPGLRVRVEKELLRQSSDPLRPDLESFLSRLAQVSTTIKQIPNAPETAETTSLPSQQETQRSSADTLHHVFQNASALEIGAAFASVPLGKSAGRATYWIHPDNLEEARVLLLRYMTRFQQDQNTLSRVPSDISGARGSPSEGDSTPRAQLGRQDVVLFDNVERFAREQSGATIGSAEATEGHVPTRIALSGWWTNAPDAYVLMSDISPAAPSPNPRRLLIRRKELDLAFSRDANSSLKKKSLLSPATSATQEYLRQHRDVKPLAQIKSSKSFFAKPTNSADVGAWASLDTNVLMSTVDTAYIGQVVEASSGEAFPHAILEIRWEFSPIPEVVRAFDSSHLVERVRGFSLEAHAIFAICKPDMPLPLWLPLLEKDIRKIPLPSPRHGKNRSRNGTIAAGSTALTSSGPSSTEGPSDSVFSLTAGQSSATSAYTTNVSNYDLNQQKPKQKKQPRMPSNQRPKRYWNEFDDGSDFEDDSYAIYVNPDEPISLPGAETVSKAFAAMYQSLSKGKRRVLSMLSLQSKESNDNERQPLLHGQAGSGDDVADSSDSDSPYASRQVKQRRATNLSSKQRSLSTASYMSVGRPLSARRQARENTLRNSYTGLLVLSYILLVMSTILKATGRKKAALEVNAGVISGVVAADGCGVIAIGLLCMRKGRTVTVLHQIAVGLAFAVVVGAGIVLMVTIVVGRAT